MTRAIELLFRKVGRNVSDTTRHSGFVVFLIFSLVPFGSSLRQLVILSLEDDRYSNVVLIPIIAAFVFFLERKGIFVAPQHCPSKAAPLLVAGLGLFCLAEAGFLNVFADYQLAVVVLAIILVWMGGFILWYGVQSFRAALFPWLFLLLMIPIPTVLMDKAVLVMREGSAVMSFWLFKLLGVPVLWQHFDFLLPGVQVEITQECSGIRSNLALFTTSILAGHMFLQSSWRRTIFSLLSIPIVIFKNAVRIVTISCLGVYVDPGFLHGRLHRYGGLPFSVISLGILLALLFALQKGERNRPEESRHGAGGRGSQNRVPAALRTYADSV